MRLRLLLTGLLTSLLLGVTACASSTAGAQRLPATATAPIPTTAIATATAKPSGPPGAISGDELMYPADSIPPLAIYAISTTNSQVYFYTQTKAGEITYKISTVAPGAYYVIAYLASPPTGNFKVQVGGYTNEVPCSLAGGLNCNDHTLIPVTVQPGQSVENINPNDYYGGTYPPRPGT